MLLTSDWQVYSPSLYVREVEGLRKDAIFLNINQLRRTWYFEYLEHTFPEVTSGSRAKIDGYLEDLRAWEKDPSAYSRNAALAQRINSRFFEMIMSMIEGQATRGPVYVTAEIATNRGGQDVELTNALMAKYKFIPKGLVFETVEKEAPGYLSEVKLNLRGLTDGSVKFDAGDVTRKKVIPVYLSMAMSSGMYFASSGRHDRAIELFRQALTIDPAFEPAKKALETSQSMLQNRQK
jgi:tetratricopeptide (TPR) repeat protein